MVTILTLVITFSVNIMSCSTGQLDSDHYKKDLLSTVQSQHTCDFYTMKSSSSLNCASYCSQRCLCRYYVFDKKAVNHQCLMCQGQILATNQLPVQFQQIKTAYIKHSLSSQILQYTSTSSSRSYWKYLKSSLYIAFSYEVTWAFEAYTITLEFKTKAQNGIIFYATHPESLTDPNHCNYVGGFLHNGFITHSIMVASGNKAVVTSIMRYNDNKWHQARFTKWYGESELCVDGNCKSSNTGDTGIVGFSYIVPEVYIGGVPNTSMEHRALSQLGIMQSFVGCMKSIKEGLTPFGLPDEHANTGPNEECAK